MSLSHWIWLTQQVPNTALARDLISVFRKPERIYSADYRMLLETGLLKPSMAKALTQARALDAAHAVLQACAASNIHLITFDDALYPERLRNIPDPPLVLYTRGAIPLFDDLLCIAVVGTRRASSRALSVAESFAGTLARHGVCIISGMAEGIDSAGHAGALRAHGLTAAVFGCGADICYPSSNKKMMDAILQNGCILSEYPPGTPPSRITFPRRNRIIAGLACGVLIVAAPEHSGSLITARLASDYGRDVFVVPGAIDTPEFSGANELIKQGASPVTSPKDIIDAYAATYRFDVDHTLTQYQLPQVPRAEDAPPKRAYIKRPPRPDDTVILDQPFSPDDTPPTPADEVSAMTVTVIEPAKPAESIVTEPSLLADPAKPAEPFLSDRITDPVELTVIDAVRNGYDYPDSMVVKTGVSIEKIIVAVTKLEIRGVLQQIPGGCFKLIR
ncbi:MAG: DNA-processing protein DprA [Clostridiaceae bacterium]|nr:DNA-processing protein DprA [Clostridiaceae bacterium]